MLTVLGVGYPLAPASPDTAGGAEQVLCALDRALVEAGHRSIVVAPAGSRVRGELVATPPLPARFDENARAGAEAAHRRAIADVLGGTAVDVVHLHGIDFDRTLPPPGPPALVTLHMPLDWYEAAALRPTRPRTFLHGVSARQCAAAPPGLDLLPPIPNGVDTSAFVAGAGERGFAMALGRICPEKGFHLALDAAAAAGVPLLLAGTVFPYPAHEAYFEAEIRPRLDRRRRFVGPLGPARKRRLLAAARCLLVSSLVEETGALVALEALASGTPVIGFARGALLDIVEPGRTGYLVDGVDGMAGAIARCGAISAGDCRRAACARFDLGRTTDAYLRLYGELARGRAGAASRVSAPVPAGG